MIRSETCLSGHERLALGTLGRQQYLIHMLLIEVLEGLAYDGKSLAVTGPRRQRMIPE